MLKGRLEAYARNALGFAGLFVPGPKDTEATVSLGNISVRERRLVDGRIRESTRRVPRRGFLHQRTPSTIEDIVYRETGVAYANGAALQYYSSRRVSLRRHVIRRPTTRPSSQIDDASVVQCLWPNTYGDWVGEFLPCLVPRLPIEHPLLIPSFLAGKAYVQRDLEALGVGYVVVSEPLQIRRAHLLPKPRPLHYWTPADVANFRRGFRFDPPTPAAGSSMYLSRYGETCENPQTARWYPSRTIEKIVSKHGTTIVRTARLRPLDYDRLSFCAETVFADHGGALSNLLRWRCRRVVELCTAAHWDPCFVHLGHALGVDDHQLVWVDGMTPEQIAEVVDSCHA